MRMAHGWDPYYHNPPPLSSDQGTFSRTSETDRTLPQHVESFIGHHEFSNQVDSQEAPLQNSDYHTSYCPNPMTTNTSSDCVYQRYCSETQWQTDENQMDKSYLPGCASGEIPGFSTDGLQTSELQNLQGFKEDCGMLATSFLENYSDVSSSSDTVETRPSCDYHARDLLVGPKADTLTEHCSSDWLSPHTGSMNFASVNPSMSASVMFPSNMKAKENEVLCMQDMMEDPEKVVESYVEQTSPTPYVTSAKINTVHVPNDFCLTHEGVERDITHDQFSNTSSRDHGNKNVIDKMDAYTDDSERKSTLTAQTTTPTDNKADLLDQKVMRKKTNQENYGSGHANSTKSEVGVKLVDKKATNEVLKRERVQSGSLKSDISDEEKSQAHIFIDSQDDIIKPKCQASISQSPNPPATIPLKSSDDTTGEVGESNSTNLTNSTEVNSCLLVPEQPCHEANQDNADKVLAEVADSQVSDANVARLSEFCNESNKFESDLNLHEESKNLAEIPNANLLDSNDTFDSSSKENTHSATTTSSSSVESGLLLHSSSVNVDTQLDKEMSGEPEGTNITLLEAPHYSVNFSRPVKTSETKKTDCGSSITNDTHIDGCKEMEPSSREQNTMTSCQDHSGSNAQTRGVVTPSDVYEMKVAPVPESCSQPLISEREKLSCKETETPTATEKTSANCLESQDNVSIAVTSDNNQSILNSESCLQPNASSTEMNSCSEMEWNSSYSDQQMPHNLVANAPTSPCDTAKNARESFEEMDLFTEDNTSVPATPYGEPLSEDSSCETDNAKLMVNKYNTTSVESRLHSEKQEPQLKSSAQLRKLLHPVVILSTFEATNKAGDSYQCKQCDHATSTVDLLIEHHHHSHGMDDLQHCETCNLYQVNGEQTECHFCGVTKKASISSNQRKRKKKSYISWSKCKSCGIEFSKLREYVSHMRKHSGKTPYKCDQCGLYFSQNCSLRRHRKVPGRCKRSQLSSTSSNADNGEIQTPPQKNRAQDNQLANIRECFVKLVDIATTNLCGICGKSFVSVAKAKKHRRAIHNIRSVSVLLKLCCSSAVNITKKKHKCPLCPTLFKYSYNRARHLRTCVREAVFGGKNKLKGKYCCPLCQATFTLSHNRYRHIYSFCLRDCINQLAKESENVNQVDKQHSSQDREQGMQPKRNPKANHEERKQQLPKSTTKITEPRFKCSLCPAVYYHYSGKYRHMKKHELFKLSGKKVKYRNSSYSVTCKTKSLSSTKRKEKEDNLKLTEAKEDDLKLTETQEDNLRSTEASADHGRSCLSCGKSFDSSKSLKKHRCKYRGERSYHCLECGKAFKRHSHLVTHKNVHQRRIQCTVCKRILPSIGKLIQHQSFHTKKGMLKCPDCDSQFTSAALLLKHIRTHKKKEKESPQLEETAKPKLQQCLESMKEQSESTQLQCSLCHEEFDDAQMLRKHCLTHIPGSSSNQCPFCLHNFGSRKYLLRHMLKHTGNKAFSCTHCGKQFYRLIFLELHTKKYHTTPHSPDYINMRAGSKLVCPYCPRFFCRKDRLKKHLIGHKKNCLHECQNCWKYFGINKIRQHRDECEGTVKNKSGSSLAPSGRSQKRSSQTSEDDHIMALQSNTKKLLPFQCPHCTRRFKYRSLYLRHLVSHTGVQPYECMHCDHRFSSQSLCLQHEAFCDGINKHGLSVPRSEAVKKQPNMATVEDAVKNPKTDGEANLKCKFCTKTFVKPRNLRRHILTHNEVKPYHCKACDCCFSRYDHLKVHQALCKGRKRLLEVCIPKVTLDDVGKGWQIRFGAEPRKKTDVFNCEVCSRSFPTQSKLSRHTTIFHTTKLFKCTRCGSAFSHEKSLKKHHKDRRCRKTSQERVASPPETILQVGNVTGQLDGMRTKILKRIQPFLTKKFKYMCTYCPRGFECRGHLNVHIRLHTGERPFSCNYCGQGFIRKDYMQRHFVKCTKRRLSDKALCEGCGSFFSSSYLENHKKICKSKLDSSSSTVEQTQQSTIDSSSKGFSCAYCKSRFLLFSQLQEHFLTTHKQETAGSPVSTTPLQQHLSNMPKIKKKHADESSDESLSDTSVLAAEHDSTPHSEVSKEFFCSDCNMSFASKAGLKGHLSTHKDKQPFNCKICNKGFWNKTLCRNHYRKCRKTHGRTRQSEGPFKAKLDFALNDSVLVFKERSKTTGTGVLQTNFSCKDNVTDESQQHSEENEDQSNSCKEKKEVQYQCSECDQSFTDGLLLISHLEDHGRQDQEKKRNTCPRCGRVCSNQANLEKHMKMHGMNKKHSCPQCPKTFYTASDLEDHMTCHDPSKPYCCRVCCVRFWSRQLLCSHYREEHKDKVISCQLCSKAYYTKKSLVRHYREIHQKEQKALGNIEEQSNEQQRRPGTTGGSGINMDSEDSDSDSAPYFPCHVCGKTFKTSESLEDHQLCHLGKKPHECAECGKCFYQASQLQQHQRMHLSEFQCQICGKGCVSLFALRKHKHTHGKSHPFQCSKCHLSFKGSSQLAEHMSSHRDDNFPCDICDRVFQSKISRAEHRKSHANLGYHPPLSGREQQQPSIVSETSIGYSTELKYRCGVCHERFRDPEELSEHGCIKAKERAYSCTDCDKHFLHASDMKKHRNTHLQTSSKSDYSCFQCNIDFSSAGDFLKHLKNHVDIADEIKCENDEEDVGPSPIFICPVCHHCFPGATKLIHHFSTQCDGSYTCDKNTVSGERWEEQGSHSLTLDGAIKCPNCFQTFWGANALNQHHCPHQPQATAKEDFSLSSPAYYNATGEEEEVDVTGDELYNCPSPLQFSSKHSLSDHNSIEKPFTCDVCGKGFALRRYMTRHRNRHRETSDVPQYKSKDIRCLECGGKFSTAQNLSRHMRLHAQQNAGDYRCDMCYKSFGQWALLRHHQESHVGEVVYECTECDKAFAVPHLLEEHQQTHAGSSL